MLRIFLDWCLFWKMRPGSIWILCLVRPCFVLWVTPKVLQISPLRFQVLGRSLHRLLLLSSKKHQCQVPVVVLRHVCSVHYNINLSIVVGFRKFSTKPRFPFWCKTSCVSFVYLLVMYSQYSLPVSQDQIPSGHGVDGWGYLSHIDKPYLEADIGIFIGNNVPRAVEPWGVINSVGDSPYHGAGPRSALVVLAIALFLRWGRVIWGWCLNANLVVKMSVLVKINITER